MVVQDCKLVYGMQCSLERGINHVEVRKAKTTENNAIAYEALKQTETKGETEAGQTFSRLRRERMLHATCRNRKVNPNRVANTMRNEDKWRM